MTHYTPLHHRAMPNGRVHLAPDVFRLDDRQPIYHRPKPRGMASWTFKHWLFWIVVNLTVWTALIWLLLAIGRAVRATGGFA